MSVALVVDRIPARAREVALVGLFAGAYFVLAQLGLSVLAEPDDVALLWPAAGLALAAVVLAPLRLWPALLAAVFGASLAVQLLSRGPEPLGAALAAITAFETLAAATLLLAVTGRARRYVFGSSRGVAGLLIASALGAGVGAAIGAGALSLALDTPYATGVATWWLADGLGMLAVAPVVLAWGDRRTPAFRREEIALLAAVALVSVAVAYPDTLSVPDPLVQAFVPLPLLCWVAVRAQPRISSLATAALVVVFTRATIDGDGPFAAAAEAAGLDKLQVFLVVAALLALLVEAVLATRRQTERKLAHATEELRSVLSAATESAIIALDVDCRVMVFNEGAQRMLGYTPREAAGRTFDVFSLPSEVTRRAAELGIDPGVEVFVRTARRGEAETRRWTVVRRDGGTLPVSLTVTPRIDDDGRLVGFIGVAQDVTESVRFETERAALIRASRAVAEGGPIEATLGLLAREMGELCDAKLAAVTRFESAELGTILGAWSASGRLGTGHPIDLRDDTAAAMVSQRGAACNIPPAAGENEPSPARAGVPVIVDSTLWGAVSVGAGSVELDADVESLLARFADLVALAVANDESRREVERKRDELSAIIDGLPALVWVRDLSGRLLLANRDFSELCGDGADQFSEELLLEALSDPTLDADALTSESATTIEQEFVDPGGDARTLLVSRWPLESDGGVYALACVATDISERRAHERAKDEFIQVVSHELRTPLSSIRGALSLLSEDESDFDDVARRRMVNIASSNSERLASLVNDILDLQRIESGAPVLDRAEWDSGSLVTQAVEDMQALAEERDIQLVSSPAAFPVYAERGRVVQVLNNFLSNAIKFSEPGGRVEVGSLTRDDEAAFYVRDEGAGIPEHLLEAVFERFHQVDSSASRAVGGTGLGLAICRQIAELHDGRDMGRERPRRGQLLLVLGAPDAGRERSGAAHLRRGDGDRV